MDQVHAWRGAHFQQFRDHLVEASHNALSAQAPRHPLQRARRQLASVVLFAVFGVTGRSLILIGHCRCIEGANQNNQCQNGDNR